ncbi:MAG: CRISPR system precrRNA processing endoribonuclease RAMP protein Cas6 [Leptospiraceae bacterium]|nr:CRISPR system precrRNA processing endoribonuclease RAMP protein Cas6 [Leptospiraceae bacterium]MCP5498563.1 CRISPR system precrRNA processing endoribonuclease RAMP protein Cas6 [Leptospiraceae bacterium]
MNKSLLSRLSFTRLSVTLKPEAEFFFPFFPGSLIRGSFGHALKEAFCVVHGKDCPSCHLSSSCGYYRLFESQDPTLSGTGFRFKPHPYNLSLPTKRSFEETGTLKFTLTLLGNFSAYIPYLIYAFELMGKKGLGKGKVPFSIDSVKDGINGNSLYKDGKLHSSRLEQISIQEYVCREEFRENTDYELQLQSPARIEEKGKFFKELKAADIQKSIQHRYRLMHSFYGELVDEDLQIEDLRLSCQSQEFVDWTRYSNRKQNRHKQGGIVGSFLLEKPDKKTYELIKAMEILHIGKQTSFGLGEVKVR